MANKVYANGREIACKAAGGKSICAFPDVCFTPPQTPATPPGVPIPYPNTGMASDTTSGSRSVKVTGKEVSLKDSSYFKKSTGDEAGSAAKKGLLTSTNRGKVYFTSWSMDVKIEGENAVRHLDMTTHNHMSYPSNTCPWPYLDSVDVPLDHPCYADIQKEKDCCEDDPDPCASAGLDQPPGTTKPYDVTVATSIGSFQDRDEWLQAAKRAARNKCLSARRCRLEPYRGGNCCCRAQTGHHLVEASSFFKEGRGDPGDLAITGMNWSGVPADVRPVTEYNEDLAPCICAEGTTSTQGSHGMLHTEMKAVNSRAPSKELTFTGGQKATVKSVKYKEARQNGAAAAKTVFPLSGCSEKCLELQLDNYYRQLGVDDETDLVAVEAGKAKKDVPAAQEHTRTSGQQQVEEAMQDAWENYDPMAALSPDPLTGAPTGGFGLGGI